VCCAVSERKLTFSEDLHIYGRLHLVLGVAMGAGTHGLLAIIVAVAAWRKTVKNQKMKNAQRVRLFRGVFGSSLFSARMSIELHVPHADAA
jgi:hypothetical protein